MSLYSPSNLNPFISLQVDGHYRHLHSFPTRRSSDLSREHVRPCKRTRTRTAACAPRRNPVRRRCARDVRLRRLELRSEEHTSELQSRVDLVCRLLLEKKKTQDKHERPTVRA